MSEYVNCHNCRAFDWSGDDKDWGWCLLLPPAVSRDNPQPSDDGCWSGIPKEADDD